MGGFPSDAVDQLLANGDGVQRPFLFFFMDFMVKVLAVDWFLPQRSEERKALTVKSMKITKGEEIFSTRYISRYTLSMI
jgi:hypothetical protein